MIAPKELMILLEKSKTLAPKTVNHLRTLILIAINFAECAGKFGGENPGRDVKPRPSRFSA